MQSWRKRCDDLCYEASTSCNSLTEAEDVEDKPRRSKRARKEKSFGEDFMMVFLAENEPKSYVEAMSTPDALSLKEAVNSKTDSLM